jgi:hypothetical protein
MGKSDRKVILFVLLSLSRAQDASQVTYVPIKSVFGCA